MGRINLQRFVKACKNSGGLISVIAKRLDVTRQSVYDFIKREPASLKYMTEAKEEILDMAESKLITSMNNDDMESIKWYLARIGRKRGYQDKEIVVNTAVQTNNVVNTVSLKELIEQAKARSWKPNS